MNIFLVLDNINNAIGWHCRALVAHTWYLVANFWMVWQGREIFIKFPLEIICIDLRNSPELLGDAVEELWPIHLEALVPEGSHCLSAFKGRNDTLTSSSDMIA